VKIIKRFWWTGGMAAETLTSWGSMKQPAGYVSSPEKIIAVGDAYVGIVGWTVTGLFVLACCVAAIFFSVAASTSQIN